MNIAQLFPTPVMIKNRGMNISSKEKNFILKNAQDVTQNVHNFSSSNTCILEDESFIDIKSFCLEVVNDYWNNILKAPDNVKPIITQSWLNYTNKNESHHKHSHPNSYLSGVFYLEARNDTITFYNPVKKQIEIDPTEFTVMNSPAYNILVNSGDCIVFPSYIEHEVPKVTTDYTRISIAFNVFPSGQLGSYERLTHTNINVIE